MEDKDPNSDIIARILKKTEEIIKQRRWNIERARGTQRMNGRKIKGYRSLKGTPPKASKKNTGIFTKRG